MRSRFTHYMLRSRYAEDCLADAAQQNRVRQCVILGAGLDTFAYRQPDWAKKLKIFEVDHPATQNSKRKRLGDAGIDIPANVHLTPIDFDEVSFGKGLSPSPFDPNVATFFSMLGVSQYLTSTAFNDTLCFVASMPGSSEFVFSIAPPLDLLPAEDGVHIEALTKHFVAIGEPWLTCPRPLELIPQLKALGFSSVFLMTPEAANIRYFHQRSDDLQASVIEQMIRAVV